MKGDTEMLKIEDGKFYWTRDGRKVGRMVKSEFGDYFYDPNRTVTSQSWNMDGSFIKGQIGNIDLVSECHDHDCISPIVTIIKRELKTGVYGAIHLSKIYEDGVNIYANTGKWSASALREAAHLFNQIAEFLEEGK